MINKKPFNFSYENYPYMNNIPEGYFFYLRGDKTFNVGLGLLKCRETFSFYFATNFIKYIGFKKENININSINEFFEIIEDKLNLKERTEFYKTDLNDTIIVEMSNFWRQNDTTIQVFTLFLRCAAIHYNGDFNKAIQTYKLSNYVKLALEHFLKGNTKPAYTGWKNEQSMENPHYYQNSKNGFVDKFRDASIAFIEKSLVKP